MFFWKMVMACFTLSGYFNLEVACFENVALRPLSSLLHIQPGTNADFRVASVGALGYHGEIM